MTRGNKRPMAPTAKQTLELRAAIHNRFDIEVCDAATGELKQRARAYNLICDTLWDKLIPNSTTRWANSSYFNYLLYGGGSGTPSVSDTGLFEKLGAKQITSGMFSESINYETGIYYRQAVVTIQAEENVGDTLTEVGIGYDNTLIVTHAMLQDMNGNPISIEKTDTDVIKIYAIIFVHFQGGGWYNGSIMLNVDLAFLRILTGSSGLYGILFRRNKCAQRTGLSGGATSSFALSASREEKTISISNRIAAGEDNLPIRAITVDIDPSNSTTSYNAFWITPGSWFSPPAIGAEAVGTGDGTTTGFSTAFPVKTAGTVYVDGVAASGVTMRVGPADAAHMEMWLNACEPDTSVKVYSNTAYGILISSLEIALSAGAKSNPLENPFYSLGIQKVRKSNGNYSNYECTVLASDNLTNWSVVGAIPATSGFAELSIPAALRNKRYWQIQAPANASAHYFVQFVADAPDTSHNIVFEAPPAAGAVITADYTPDCIAKDENHVFDLNMVLTLGEYQEV